MKSILFAGLALTSVAAFAEVKPSTEPWLKEGETLVCYGDSITAGKNYYVKYLKEALEPRGIKVVNAGVSGDKTPMALTRIKDVAALKPDAVLFFFGANDSVIGRGRWRDEPVVEPTTFRDNLVWMMHYFKLKTPVRKFAIVAPTGRCEGAARGEFGDICRGYQQAAREAADRMDAVLIPLDFEFETIRAKEGKGPNDLLLTADGVHFSAYGSQRAADLMLRCWNLAAPAK